MHSRKIYRLLQALPETEIQAFHLYLQSPLLNNSSLLTHFFELLLPELTKEPASILSAPNLHQQLPTESKFSKNYFDKLCATLVKALYDFLQLQELRNNELHTLPALMSAMNRLRLDEFIPSLYRNLAQELEHMPAHDAEWLNAHYLLEYAYGSYQFRQPRQPGGEQLLRIDQHLDESYFARKLDLVSALHNYNVLFKEQLQAPDLKALRTAIEADPDRWPLLIRIKYHTYLLLAEQSEASFITLMQLLETEGNSLAGETRSEVYIAALNFCTFQINQGNTSYLQEADQLYMRLIDGGWLLQKGKLPSEFFKNIISLRLRMGAADWVETFIEEYGDRLSNSHQGMAVLYSRALLQFYRDQFEPCIRNLNEVLRDVKSDIYYGIDSRVFLLKAYYLRNLPDDSYLLESNLNAFRLYILRHKSLGDESRKRYGNILRLFRGLIRLRELPISKRANTLKKLQKEIQSLPLSNRVWFEEQVQTLLN